MGTFAAPKSVECPAASTAMLKAAIAPVRIMRSARKAGRTIQDRRGRPMPHIRRIAPAALRFALAGCGGVPLVPII